MLLIKISFSNPFFKQSCEHKQCELTTKYFLNGKRQNAVMKDLNESLIVH